MGFLEEEGYDFEFAGARLIAKGCTASHIGTTRERA